MKELVELHQAFYDAIERGDFQAMSEIWAEDTADRVPKCVHPGWPMLSGRSEVLRSWALIMANTPYIQFVLTDVEANVFGDVAVLTCAENILTAPDAGEPGFAAGRVVASHTYLHTEDGWRLWLYHGSPVLQGEEDGRA